MGASEVEGRVLIAQEHQPSPPELYVRLVTAYSSHGISYVFSRLYGLYANSERLSPS